MINLIKKWRINRENKRFIERMKNGEVNYEFQLAGSENHESEKELVDHLSAERANDTYIKVKRLKDMDKETFEDTMGELLSNKGGV